MQQIPRLSISNCALPTAVDWAVRRKLREWHHRSSTSQVSYVSPSIGFRELEPSPFWISAKVAYLLCNPYLCDKRSADDGNSLAHGGRRFASLDAKADEKMVFFVNWDRAVTVFGTMYVNAADTSFCFLMDSTTCLSLILPVDEAGEIILPLVKGIRRMALSTYNASCEQFGSPCSSGALKNVQLQFHSPYWLETSGLESRWKGVSIAGNASPFYHNIIKRSFINAEQTTDASRFDSLSCGPHRRHQCFSMGGMYYISWELSVKLSEAFSNMKEALGNVSLPSVHTNDQLDTDIQVSQNAQKQQQQELLESEHPSNLWIDVELIEMAGWSLHKAAVGVEVPLHQMTRVLWLSAKKTSKTIVVVNAELVVDREELLDLITYRPECIGLEGGFFLSSAASARLALLSHQRKYNSSTWICATLARAKSLCGSRGGDVTGVEVPLVCRQSTEIRTTVLINREELDLSEGRIAEFRDRYAYRACHSRHTLKID